MSRVKSHPIKRWDLDTSLRWYVTRTVFLLLAMTLFMSSTYANDEELKEILAENAPPPAGYYSPEFCEFEMTFPEQPITLRSCANGNSDCFNLQSFTYVYDMQTTLEVTAQCTKSTPESYGQYSETVIKTVLNGMVKRANVNEFELNVQEMEDQKTRQGSLLGTGRSNGQDKIYNAQIWIGQNSIMTIEGHTIGLSNEKADEAFADILASVGVKN